MDFVREFIKDGYLKAIGKMEEYKIILGASAYFDRGILKEEDLKEINEAINKQYEETTDQTATNEEENVAVDTEVDSTENVATEVAEGE